jgi:hypothetical protein
MPTDLLTMLEIVFAKISELLLLERKHSKALQRFFRYGSVMLPASLVCWLPQCCKDVAKNPKMLQRCGKDVTKMLQRCDKDVAKMLQRCDKDVAKMLQRCYKDVSKMWQRTLKSLSGVRGGEEEWSVHCSSPLRSSRHQDVSIRQEISQQTALAKPRTYRARICKLSGSKESIPGLH